MSKDEDTEEIKDEATEEIKRIKTFKDVQRTHLEKLMSNPVSVLAIVLPTQVTSILCYYSFLYTG